MLAEADGQGVSSARLSERSFWCAVAALSSIAAALRAFHLSYADFWNDEYASYVFSTEPIARVLGPDYSAETNPPLYYLLQRAWLYFGDSRAAMRSLPLLFGVLTVPLTALIARRLLGRSAALIGAALVTCSELEIHYSRELRGYTLLQAASLGAVACLVQIFARHGLLLEAQNDSARQPEKRADGWLWLGYGACTLVALYTHSTAVLLPVLSGSIFASVWLAGRISLRDDRALLLRGLVLHALIALCFLPRLSVTLSQSRDVLPDFWVPASTPRWVYAQLLGAYPFPKWSKPLFLASLVWGAWVSRRRPFELGILLAFVVGQPVLLYLASLFRHVFIVRALMWPTALALALIGRGLYAMSARTGQIGVLLATFTACALELSTFRNNVPDQPQAAAIAAFAEPLRDLRPQHDRLVFAPLEFAWALWYEERALGLPREGLGVTFGDHPLQLESWYGAQRVRRTEVVSHLGGVSCVWLLIERVPKFPHPSQDGFATLISALENWGDTIRRWQSGRFDLLLLQRRDAKSFASNSSAVNESMSRGSR